MSRVTSRTEKDLEKALTELAGARSGRDRMFAVLEQVDDGVVVVDATGVQVFGNEAAARFSGARHSDAIVERAINELIWLALEGESQARELDLFGPPREVLYVRASPLQVGGELFGAAAFVRNISEARRVENVRRDFVANVSHELKTPVGALALLAETLADSRDPEESRRLTVQVLREAERLERIIADLLDLSLIEGEELRQRAPVQVSTVLRSAVDRVRSAAAMHEILIDSKDLGSDLVIEADSRLVTSAVANLLDNAVKYSEAGRRVELRAVSDGDAVVIEVSDHGMGIPSEDLERIFERFYRVDRARSRSTGGTGLGLAIVRHVAEAHGGTVTVESLEGEGSTFRLVLPRRRDV